MSLREMSRVVATLTSFGSPAARKRVKGNTFVLKADSGAFTVPEDWYVLDKKFGMVVQRSSDDSETETEWEDHTDFTWSGHVVIDTVKTPVTDEALTFADEDDEWEAIGPEGQIEWSLWGDGVAEGSDVDEVGGWDVTDTQFSSANGGAVLNAATPFLMLGNLTGYSDATVGHAGFWVGNDSGTYKQVIGSRNLNQYMSWDGAQLYVSGTIAGTIVASGTDSNTWTVNQDLSDANVDLVLGRTTGGNATLRWNGSVISVDKIFSASQSVGILSTAPLAPLHVGAYNVNASTDSQILISRQVGSELPGVNGHAFSDSSSVLRANTSYNSFDARITMDGSGPYGHYAAFQVGATYNSTGALSLLYGLAANPIIANGSGAVGSIYGGYSKATIESGAGTVSNNYGWYSDNPTSSGTVTYNFGVYVKNQTAGLSGNWGVYIDTVASATNIPLEIRHTGTGDITEILLNRTTAAVGDQHLVKWKSSTLEAAAIGAEITAAARADLVFFTTHTAGANLSEAMRLDADGNLGLGTVTPRKRADFLSTTSAQLRLSYADNSIYSDFTVGSGGNLTIAPTGDLVLDPVGNDVLPNLNYDINLGMLSKKYLTLHAAELWVETLVAQNTLATIGGRILILPTNILIADAAAAATTLDVKYNNLANGDRIYLEANGAVEFMAVTSGASVITGGYRYSVTRNLDGTGANQWYAGDAIANTGTTGSGWIDAYSVRGVKASSEAGPTIAGNIRNSSTYNDWSTMWAIGNLNGLYGYGADTPGAAFGKYASGNPNITVDTTNGIRIRNFTTTVGQWDTSGNITVGEVGASKSNVYITSNKVQLRTNTTVQVELDTAGKIIVGEVANSKARIEISAGTIGAIARSGAGVDSTYFALATSGNVTLGKVAASNANILFDASAGTLSFRVNTTTNIYINTSGAMVYSADSASYAKWVTGSAALGELWSGASGGFGSMVMVGRGKDATDTIGVAKLIAYKHDNSYNSQLALSSYGSVTLTGRDGVASQLTTLYARDFGGGTTVQGTTTETEIYSATINGNAMGAQGVLVVELGGDLKNNSGLTPNLTFRVKFGGTTICTLKVSSIASFAATGGYFIRAVIANDGNTNVQRAFAMLVASRNGQWDGTSADYGAGAIDTTSNTTVSITAQWSTASGSPEAPGVFSKGGLVRLERTN